MYIFLDNEEKDTIPEHLERVTFHAPLKTFEMEIMEKMGIEATGTPPKTYWH